MEFLHSLLQIHRWYSLLKGKRNRQNKNNFNS
nr:MAG TPA: hypothetical protein [Caudoviricetes sp.]